MIFERSFREPGEISGQREVTTHVVRFDTVEEEILFLRQMVDEYRGRTKIRELATDIVFRQAGLPPKKQAAHALAIGEWVQQHITYVNELPETFQTPVRTLRFGYGDCDDGTTLTCSLLEAIGIPSELVAMHIATLVRPKAFLPWERFGPGGWKHIFPRALVRVHRRPFKMPLDWSLSRPVGELRNPIRLSLARGDKLRVLVV